MRIEGRLRLGQLQGFLHILQKRFITFVGSTTFLKIIFAWFFIQATYIAFSTRLSVPPDENYHLTFIKLFAEKGWLPVLSNQDGYFSLGEAVRTPFFLYHYLLSIVYKLFSWSVADVFLLRLVNVFMGAGSVYVVYLIARAANINKSARNIALFMLSNTLMFVFLSASINYDNLFILLSVSAIFLSLRILQTPTPTMLILLSICLLSGSMVKISFLPIMLITVLVSLFGVHKHRVSLAKNTRAFMKSPGKTGVLISVVLAMLVCLFLQRYAVNIVKYRSFEPKCNQVLTTDQCRENYIFARNERLLNSPRPKASKNLYEYTAGWVYLMHDRSFGIFSHKSIDALRVVSAWIMLILLPFGVIATIRYCKSKDQEISVLLLITVFYMVVLIIDNLNRYHRFGSFTFAVQGRYAFPVLPIIYLLGNHFIYRMLRDKLLYFFLSLITLAIFSIASLPTYIYRTDSSWHNTRAEKINAQVRGILQ